MSERTNEQIKEEILDRLEMVTDPELGVDIVNSVSYTHLTLPTKA